MARESAKIDTRAETFAHTLHTAHGRLCKSSGGDAVSSVF